MYHLRHDEDDWIVPVTLERLVVVNFFGTVFMKEPMPIGPDGYVEIENFAIGKKLVVFRLSGAVVQSAFGIPDNATDMKLGEQRS